MPVPLVTLLIGVVMRGLAPGRPLSWPVVYGAVVYPYATLFLPLLAGVLTTLCCQIEHLVGGWKQLFGMPVPRTAVYAAKVAYALLFLALAQALVLLAVRMDGRLVLHLSAPFPWSAMAGRVAAGWVATVPLTALQLWVSARWSSFAAPFALNVIGTLPATAAGGTWAQVYPWCLPALAMLSHLTPVAVITLCTTGAALIVGGWWHCVRRDLPA